VTYGGGSKKECGEKGERMELTEGEVCIWTKMKHETMVRAI
jgi:hypothetical protein